MRVVKQWHKLPQEVVEVLSLETFKVSLDRAVSNLVYMKMSPLTAVELEQMAFKGQFLPKPFCDSWGRSSAISEYSTRGVEGGVWWASTALLPPATWFFRNLVSI